MPKDFKLPSLNKKEKALREALTHAPRPKLAATIVLTCGPKDNPRILMGQRSRGHDFMPSVYVFPGGRVDRGDSYAPYVGALSPRTETVLESAFAPRRALAIVLAAIRETYEETGLLLARPHMDRPLSRRHPGWQAFLSTQHLPDIDGIEVFGRAVTPPHRHKRFDAWFFHKDLGETPPPAIADSSELLNVGWFTFDEIKNLEKARATQMMLDVLETYLSHDTAPETIFYSRMIRGEYMMSTDFPLVP